MKVKDFDPRAIWGRLVQHRERLGVELCGSSVRIVRIQRSGELGWSLQTYGELDIDLRKAGGMDRQRFKAAVRQLGSGLTRVAVNLDAPTLRVRRMAFAKMPERDLLQAIRWNFREHVEVPIEQYTVCYTPLDEDLEENKISVMAYGVASETIGEYAELTRALGLKLVSLEPVATALLAAMHANGILEDGRVHVCIAFGNDVTHFLVMRNDVVLFSRPLGGFSHEALIKLIQRNLNLTEPEVLAALSDWMSAVPGETSIEAEDRDQGGEQLSHRIDMTIGHFFSHLVIEVQRSIDAFCIMYNVDRVDAIHTCGIGVYYPGLVAHVHKSLGVETSVFNPFDRLVETERMTEEARHQAPLYAVSVGLALP